MSRVKRNNKLKAFGEPEIFKGAAYFSLKEWSIAEKPVTLYGGLGPIVPETGAAHIVILSKRDLNDLETLDLLKRALAIAIDAGETAQAEKEFSKDTEPGGRA